MTAQECQDKAKISELIGIPYSKLDCQALMEEILTRGGVPHKNWIGSNDMWRNAVTNASTVSEWKEIPVGAWLFTIKHDGKEPSYYHDGINAAHVGWYCGNGIVIHSTTGGVQWDMITSGRWTHAALCKLLEYPEGTADSPGDPPAGSATIIQALEQVRALVDSAITIIERGGLTNG